MTPHPSVRQGQVPGAGARVAGVPPSGLRAVDSVGRGIQRRLSPPREALGDYHSACCPHPPRRAPWKEEQMGSYGVNRQLQPSLTLLNKACELLCGPWDVTGARPHPHTPAGAWPLPCCRQTHLPFLRQPPRGAAAGKPGWEDGGQGPGSARRAGASGNQSLSHKRKLGTAAPVPAPLCHSEKGVCRLEPGSQQGLGRGLHLPPPSLCSPSSNSPLRP